MKHTKFILSILAGFIVIAGFAIQLFTSNPLSENDSPYAYEVAEIVRVKDGDTLLCKYLDSGEEYTVRLIGINTPESVHEDEDKNTIYGDMASEYTKALMPKGTIVYLVKDVDDVDQYDRKLRYVYLDTSLTTMVNEVLLKEGYCTTMRIEPNVAHADAFYQLMQEAMEQKKGLWKYDDFTNSQ